MVSIKNLKKGSYIIVDKKPVLVKDLAIMSIANPLQANIIVKVQDMISGETKELLTNAISEFEEAPVQRRCASIISKSKDGIKIIDAVSFETIKADIDKELLSQAEENDQVTYIKYKDSIKILEIRNR